MSGSIQKVLYEQLWCKIFYDSSLNKLEESINAWIREHPNAYIEQQETTPIHFMNSATGMVVVTLWYTEDSE